MRSSHHHRGGARSTKLLLITGMVIILAGCFGPGVDPGTDIGTGAGDSAAGEPYDIVNASATGTELNVHSQALSASDITFNDDGTSLYIVGHFHDRVSEYTLSSPYDLSTASSPAATLDVRSESNDPRGLVFSNDGTKLLVADTADDVVVEYDLSSPFDLGTASASTASLDLYADGFTCAQDLAFGDDGKKLYVVDMCKDAVGEYSLTTAYDLSTAAATGNELPVDSVETAPKGVSLSGDGTRLYIVENADRVVMEYVLTSPFDLSTASASGTEFSVAAEMSSSVGFAFSADGTKFFVIGKVDGPGDTVVEYAVGPE